MKIKLKKYKKVKSTNDIALKLIKKNNSYPMLVMSKEQTNGRGRMGKRWISQKGNLFISSFFKYRSNMILGENISDLKFTVTSFARFTISINFKKLASS